MSAQPSGAAAAGTQPAEPNGMCVPLLFHELRPEPGSYSYALPVAQFREYLDLLATPSPGTWPAVLTFDDGHRSDYELALPALQQAGRTASFFITAGWTGSRADYMDQAELRALAGAGMQIGAHGWSHALLSHCTPAELRREMEEPRKMLEDTLGQQVTELSLPGGRSSAAVLRAAGEAGYTRIWTSTPGAAPRDASLQPRFNVRSSLSSADLARLLDPHSGALQRARRLQQGKAAAQRLLGDRAYAALWRLVNRADDATPSFDKQGVPPA